jgi:hypothetical protein
MAHAGEAQIARDGLAADMDLVSVFPVLRCVTRFGALYEYVGYTIERRCSKGKLMLMRQRK